MADVTGGAAGPASSGAARVPSALREAVELVVGLGVVGLLRFRSEREGLEEGLERLGLGPAAAVSRAAGGLVEAGLHAFLGAAGRGSG